MDIFNKRVSTLPSWSDNFYLDFSPCTHSSAESIQQVSEHMFLQIVGVCVDPVPARFCNRTPEVSLQLTHPRLSGFQFTTRGATRSRTRASAASKHCPCRQHARTPGGPIGSVRRISQLSNMEPPQSASALSSHPSTHGIHQSLAQR